MILDLFIAYSVTLVILTLLKSIAPKLNLVDQPGGRKAHHRPIPVVGGIAMFITLSYYLLWFHFYSNEYFYLWSALCIVFTIGLIDDILNIRPKSRLVIQTIAAMIMVLVAGHAIHALFDFHWLWPVGTGPFAIPLTLFATVTLINAINMLDGMDGLAGSVVLGQASLLLYLVGSGGLWQDFQVFSVFVAILLAFLTFNFPISQRQQASVFMGDAGSMMIALFVGWYSVKLTQEPVSIIKPVTMLWIFALPLFDIICVIVRRIRKKLPLFKADHSHFHHIFLQAGYSKLETVYIIASCSITMGALGVYLDKAAYSDELMLIGIVIAFSFYYWVNLHAWRIMKLIRIKRTRRKAIQRATIIKEGNLT